MALAVTKTVRRWGLQRVDTADGKEKRPGRIPLPGAVEPKFRYGRLTVVPSPDAEMLNVPAAVPPTYA